MNAARKKPSDDDDKVQKVEITDVGPKAKEVHEKAIRTSLFTDKVLIAFFGAVVACATLGQMWMQYQTGLAVEAGNKADKEAAVAQARSNSAVAAKAAQAAEKVEMVKETLDSATKQIEATNKHAEVTLNEVKEVTKKTHDIVNSGSMITLKLNAELSRWKANQTMLPEDIKAAETAEQNVLENEKKQAEAASSARKAQESR